MRGIMRIRLGGGRFRATATAAGASGAAPNKSELGKQPFMAQFGQGSVEPPSNSAPAMLDPRHSERLLKKVSMLMHEAVHMRNSSLPNATLRQLREDYLMLNMDYRQRALIVLGTQFGVDRKRLKGLMQHYMTLNSVGNTEETIEDKTSDSGIDAAHYRTERDLRAALVPLSSRLFEQMNGQVGGLKFLVDLRADLKTALLKNNLASLRALDSDLQGLFATWLSPACLELHRITWNDAACLLEKIVTYEAVHPITNLYDLKRRLGTGRRCFGYFHPAMPGEPLVFIEVALTKGIEGSAQKVLFGEPPCDEAVADCALFYSITSTQPGLKGIELGNFLIKRVVHLLRQEMPEVQNFVTLSPIPGFMHWLLAKLATQCHVQKSGDKSANSKLSEKLLFPEEEVKLEACRDEGNSKGPVEFMYDVLSSAEHEWASSEKLLEALRPPLLRLCARYILQEKKRGAALDPSVEQLNWMGDTSSKGLAASAGLMVNYRYRLEDIEANNQAYLNRRVVAASPAMLAYLQQSRSDTQQ
nr:malonyl-CoA decarboxylase, mitochondrial-like isoform X4 [Physcomitrium patens]|eukprot:XP_024380358.1 malonyl-CoA decarboxylase, mitochondrial-like isoform X4 [Physcomitrella patens]